MIKGVGTCEPQLCIAHWPSCICIYGGPIDRTPHEIYTSQFSLLLGRLFFVVGVDAISTYYCSVQQILSGSSGSWVRILLSFITNLFFLSNWRDLHFNEHIRLEIPPNCDIKAENSSTLCKFHNGRRGLPPMGSNADPCMLRRVAQLLRLHAVFIHCLHFIYAHKFAFIRSYKLCHSGNPP